MVSGWLSHLAWCVLNMEELFVLKSKFDLMLLKKSLWPLGQHYT